MTGKQVTILLNQQLKPGAYEIDFNASGLVSEVYFYKLTETAGKEVYTNTKKRFILK